MVVTAAIASAGRSGASPPALTAAGNTRQTPSAHSAAPRYTDTSPGPSTVSSTPTKLTTPPALTAPSRPSRSATAVPENRPPAMATANTAYPAAASDWVAPRSSVRYSASQSAAAPSNVVAHRVTTPTSNNRPVNTRGPGLWTRPGNLLRPRRRGLWIPTATSSRGGLLSPSGGPGTGRAGSRAPGATITSAVQNTATAEKWRVRGMPAWAARAPQPAPAMPPTLQQAW